MTFLNPFVEDLASKGERLDGRKLDAFRDIKIETGIIENAEGSARVKLGNTEVLVGVKMDVMTPFPDTPAEGVLMVGAELSPISHPSFEPGPPRENAIELARVVDRGIRESKAIDMKQLCIKEREKVWAVMIDIQPINHDGNLLDAAGIGATAALATAKMPTYDEKTETVDNTKRTKKLPITCKPIPVSLYKINGNLFVDASIDEEESSTVRFTVSTKDDGNVCAVQKSGIESLTVEEIEKCIEVSGRVGKKIRGMV